MAHRIVTRVFFAFAALALCAVRAVAAPGDLDPTFGSSGIVRIDSNTPVPTTITASARQADGKFIVAAELRGPPGTTYASVGRINADGTMDTTFGAGGWVSIMSGSTATAIAPAAGGKVLVGVAMSGNGTPAMLRLNPDGSRDMLPAADAEGFMTVYGVYDRRITALAELVDGSMLWATSGSDPYGYEATRSLVIRLGPWGGVDCSWADCGRANVELGDGYEQLRTMLMLADGSIVVGGWGVTSFDQSPSLRDAVIAKLTPAGSLDTGFGTGGRVAVDFASGDDEVAALVLDPQSRLLALGKAGWTYGNYGESGFGLIRMNAATGVLDPTFGTGGKYQLLVGFQGGQGEASVAMAVEFLANGDLLVGGPTRPASDPYGQSRIVVARLDGNAQGLIPTFGIYQGIQYGIETNNYNPRSDWLAGMSAGGGVIQLIGTRYTSYDLSNGYALRARIDESSGQDIGTVLASQALLSGVATSYSTGVGSDGRLRVVGENGLKARVYSRTASGAADLSWGYQGNGLYLGRQDFQVESLLTRGRFGALFALTGGPEDGGMMVASLAGDAANPKWAVTCLDWRGLKCSWFGPSGFGDVSFPALAGGEIAGIELQAGYKTVVAGTATASPSSAGFALARLTSSGALDPEFNGGNALILPASGIEHATAMAIQPDGRILVAGYTASNQMKVVRVTSSGVLDSSFGAGGVAVVDFGTSSSAHAIAVAPDGKILLGGTCTTSSVYNRACVVRLLANGAMEPFVLLGPAELGASFVTGLAVQGDGRIVAAGDRNLTYPFVLRWNVYGDLDTTYQGTGYVLPSEPANTWQAKVFDDGRVLMTSYAASPILGNQTVLMRFEGEPLDSVPDAFTFVDMPLAPVDQYVVSAPVTITGIIGPTAIAVQGGEYSIGCSGVYAYQGTILGGQSVCVRHRTSALENEFTHTTLTVGGVSDTFTSLTGTLPDTVLLAAPAAFSASSSATFEFGSNQQQEPAFLCSIDSQASTPCTSPKEYTGLSEDNHTFSVRAVSSVGSDPSPASYSWRIDVTAPQTTLDSSGPSGATNQTSATFAFTGSDPSTGSGALTFECRLDGAAFAACTSPARYTGLAAGNHVFEVRTVDPSGNVDPTPASRSWTIDLVAPDTTITGGPPPSTNASTSTWTFASDDPGAIFECNGGGSWLPCETPLVFQNNLIAEGTYTLYVRAKDAAGNVDPTPASRTFTIDRTAPQTMIDSGPSALTSSQSSTFTFSSNEAGVSFECRLDGAAFAACASPAPYTGLAGGAHTFEVRAIDAATNVDASPAAYAWTIDLAAPDTLITSGPPTLANTGAATFTFNATESGSTFECRLDAAAFAACTSPISYSSLADGSHSFEVRATDGAGNVDPTPGAFTWTIDTAGPETTITSGPTGTTTQTSATLAFTSNDGGATYECRLDGAAFAPCTSPLNLAGLTSATHVFDVRAIDNAGNPDPTPASRTWTVDTTPPETTITGSPPNPTNATSASFSFISSDAGSTFECKLDGGAFAACTSPKSYSGLSNGSHTFSVRATDTVGHVDASPATFTWTIDRTAPNTTIASGPSGSNNPNTATFTFTASEAGSTFECKLDAGAFVACTTPTTYTGLAIGNHTFQVRAIDAAGNVDNSPASRNWGVK